MSRRILLDECLPRKLADLLDGEAVTTVPKQGWASKRNEELLTLASLAFDVFVTKKEQLHAWMCDPGVWPRRRSRDMLLTWFDVQACEMVFDVGRGTIFYD